MLAPKAKRKWKFGVQSLGTEEFLLVITRSWDIETPSLPASTKSKSGRESLGQVKWIRRFLGTSIISKTAGSVYTLINSIGARMNSIGYYLIHKTYLHKFKSVKIPAGIREGVMKSHPYLRIYWQLMVARGRRVHFLQEYVYWEAVVLHPCMYRQQQVSGLSQVFFFF